MQDCNACMVKCSAALCLRLSCKVTWMRLACQTHVSFQTGYTQRDIPVATIHAVAITMHTMSVCVCVSLCECLCVCKKLTYPPQSYMCI